MNVERDWTFWSLPEAPNWRVIELEEEKEEE